MKTHQLYKIYSPKNVSHEWKSKQSMNSNIDTFINIFSDKIQNIGKATILLPSVSEDTLQLSPSDTANNIRTIQNGDIRKKGDIRTATNSIQSILTNNVGENMDIGNSISDILSDHIVSEKIDLQELNNRALNGGSIGKTPLSRDVNNNIILTDNNGIKHIVTLIQMDDNLAIYRISNGPINNSKGDDTYVAKDCGVLNLSFWKCVEFSVAAAFLGAALLAALFAGQAEFLFSGSDIAEQILKKIE